MRLFFAVEPPEQIRERLFEAGRELEGKGVRRVAKENLHITLKFLGEKSEEEAREIIEKAGRIAFEKFEIEVCGVGAFPNEKFVRVIWAGAKADKLSELARKIENALGLPPENFSSHITLARVSGRADLKEFFGKYRQEKFGKFEVGSFLLKKSELGATGPRYQNLAEINGREL